MVRSWGRFDARFILGAVGLVVGCGSGISPSPIATGGPAAPAQDAIVATPEPDAEPVDQAAPACKTDADCKAAGGVCDPGSGQCVACLVHDDCAAAGDRCVDHACLARTPCQSDKACTAAGLVCDAAAGFCVACLGDIDCPAGHACKAQTCLPAPQPCVTSKECGDGQVCDKAAGLCVGCVGDADCGDPAYCFDTVCLTDTCHAGASTCLDAATRRVCAANGAGWSDLACGPGAACSEGQCVPVVCAPGTTTCQDGLPATCNALGTAWTPQAACSADQVCAAGQCTAKTCQPGGQKCDGNAVLTCGADGLSWSSAACPAAATGAAQACVLEQGVPTCKPMVCVPAAAACDQGKVVQCDATGTTAQVVADCNLPSAGGSKQQCLGGKCVEAKCVPGTLTCADGTVLATCDASGLGYTKTPCPAGQACDGNGCKPIVCTSGQASCQGTQIVQCNGTGTATMPLLDCAAKGQTCIGGACAKAVCEPAATKCDGPLLATCDAFGTGWAGAACPDDHTCAGGSCKPVVCLASSGGCDGKLVMACDATGTAWSVVADCGAAGKSCAEGKCVAWNCQPGSSECQGGQAATCKADGSAWTLTPCAKTEACDAGKCVPFVCLGAPGAGACSKQTVAATAVGLGPDTAAGVSLNDKGEIVLDAPKSALNLKYLWVSNSPEATVSKVECKTGAEVGRYKICSNPSRTSVDLQGNVWIGCRGDGGVAKIAGDAKACIDKDGNGVIDTSKDVNGDKKIQPNEMVPNDECLQFIVYPDGTTVARAAGIDKDDHAWIGFWNSKKLHRLEPAKGASVDSVSLPCSPYGLVIDQKGIIWVQGAGCGLVSYNPVTKAVNKYNPPSAYSAYGISLDLYGQIWLGGGWGAARYNPKDGTWLLAQGVSSSSAVATSKEGFAYVVNDGPSTVTKIDVLTGKAVGTISLGSGRYPHGVALDGDGFVWAVNLGKGTVSKVDPTAMALVGEYPVGPSPYTYSDMTGYTLNYFTAPKGKFTVVFQGQAAQQLWLSLEIGADLPADASLEIRYRVAGSTGGLAAVPWTGPVTSPPALLPLALGQGGVPPAGAVLQVEIGLVAGTSGATPAIQSVSAVAKAQ